MTKCRHIENLANTILRFALRTGILFGKQFEIGESQELTTASVGTAVVLLEPLLQLFAFLVEFGSIGERLDEKKQRQDAGDSISCNGVSLRNVLEAVDTHHCSHRDDGDDASEGIEAFFAHLHFGLFALISLPNILQRQDIVKSLF